MIGHHTKRHNLDREDRGKAQHIVLNLLTTMFVATVGEAVKSTEKSLLGTATHAMIERSVIKGDLLFSRYGHSGYVLQQTTTKILPEL